MMQRDLAGMAALKPQTVALTRWGKLRRLLRYPKCWSALFRGVLASTEHVQVLRALAHTGCRTVVDIGANRGQFTLAARTIIPTAQLYSFEPLAGPAASFASLFENDEKVTFHECAIGPVRAEAQIHVSARDDSSSLLPIGELQSRIFLGTAEVATQRVQVAPLSQFLSASDVRPPALLKLDVQGYELEALKGCADLLSLFSHVYAECSFLELYRQQALADEIVLFLSECGFVLSGIYNLVRGPDGKPLQGDFLFLNERTANGVLKQGPERDYSCSLAK